MFFDEQGNYNLETFIPQLNKYVKKGEKFALICRTGIRTQVLGSHLGKQMGYNVIDLQGGIMYAISKKLPTEPYKPKP
jgi:rhodanese-related sulfurtransferase